MERFSESDCPSCCVPVPVDLMPDGDLVRYADAQATIAALQARVQELEAIKISDDAFTYCAYCGKKSPVDEHNEDLAAHIKVCPKHPMRDVESQLTQRTAELEAAKRANTRYGLEIKDLRKTIDEWRAELERVRGERDEAIIKVDKWRDKWLERGAELAKPCCQCGHSSFDPTQRVVQSQHRHEPGGAWMKRLIAELWMFLTCLVFILLVDSWRWAARQTKRGEQHE